MTTDAAVDELAPPPCFRDGTNRTSLQKRRTVAQKVTCKVKVRRKPNWAKSNVRSKKCDHRIAIAI